MSNGFNNNQQNDGQQGQADTGQVRRRRSINSVTVSGYVGQDPTIINKGSGVTASFSLAIDNSYTHPKTGVYVEQTTWVRAVAFQRRAEIVRDYVYQGQQLLLHDAQMVDNSYVNDEGKNVQGIQLVVGRLEFLSRKTKEEAMRERETGRNQGQSQRQENY